MSELGQESKLDFSALCIIYKLSSTSYFNTIFCGMKYLVLFIFQA